MSKLFEIITVGKGAIPHRSPPFGRESELQSIYAIPAEQVAPLDVQPVASVGAEIPVEQPLGTAGIAE